MKVCANCFNDTEIKQFIIGSSIESDVCDCCESKSDLIDLNELSDFFVEFLKLFIKDDNGESLVDTIEQDWNIFSTKECANKVISEVLQNNPGLGYNINDKVSYIQEIQECFKVWDNLKREVQEEKRYFSNVAKFDWSAYIRPNAKIDKGDVYYRARIVPADKDKLTPSDMGCPPRKIATAGRANPIGIPYLYLCDNIDTTYYEIRAVYLDRVSVGRFAIQRDLDIVDFSNEINLFYAFSTAESNTSLIEIIKNKILFDKISKDLSKPIRRFDTEVEYVPTQLICEYCKHINADGVRFKSSVHQKGTNVVLFDMKDAKCTKVYQKKITAIKITGDNH